MIENKGIGKSVYTTGTIQCREFTGLEEPDMLDLPLLSPIGGVPVGTIMMFSGPNKKDWLERQGWLICDGRLVSTNTYEQLYTLIGNSYGTSEEMDRFYIPDCRGLFVRGVNQDSENDPEANTRIYQNEGGNTGNEVGTVQNDEFKSHLHDINATESSGNQKRFSAGTNTTYVSGVQTGYTGGKETRPKNIAFYYIIRAK